MGLQIVKKEIYEIVTSLEIAEIIGKEHKTILRDIRNEIKQLGDEKAENNFVLGYYKDKNNQDRPMYNITKIGALQLAARYDAVVRYNLIERVMELSKNEINSTGNIIDDPKKIRLQKALDDLEYTRNVLKIKKDKLILQEKYLKEKRKIKAKITKKGSD
mgnify:FL=1